MIDEKNEIKKTSVGANKAMLLFDDQYILKTYRKKILARFPEHESIKKIVVEKHKSNVWETTYHVVVEYKVYFLTKEKKEKIIPIFCSAHSAEPRKNVYESLKFLWQNGFDDTNKNKLTVPKPLFYSKTFRGTFYVGVKGKNLYRLIEQGDLVEIEKTVLRAASWLAKLHSLPVGEAWNFNKDNSRIKTAKPGMKHIFEKVQSHYPDFYLKYRQAYEEVNKKEKEFLAKTGKRWLVHGDAHPENIIRMNGGWIAMIDFNDLSLTDFARDLGSFMQQLEFKMIRHIGDKDFAQKMKNAFLDKYLKNAKIKLTDDLRARINNYYNWTLLRTVTYFLLKHHPMSDRAEELFNTLHNKKQLC